MALIKCPNCGKEISEKAFKCLYCGTEIKPKIEEDECQLASISKNENTQKSSNVKTDYQQLGLVSIVLGCLAWIIGIAKVFIYRSGEEYPYNSINAYVGGDAYNIIINATYFAGLAVIGGTFIISGILLMIYEKLQDNKNEN